MEEFEKGDRIVLINNITNLELLLDNSDKIRFTAGLIGTICEVNPKEKILVGVDFDADIQGHDCTGNAKWNHGYYIAKKHLKHLNEKILKIKQWKGLK